MKPVMPKPLRCAIYTRKSTEHNLDLAFNSLDAQREACEAYVKSQAHEGWRLLPEHYDDGGLSGASLDRPALQQLLTEVRQGRVDVIVVYKVDRLTRSLTDFAKLVETFDAHEVSFVSVTQSFNTTSSMGRLTLNVLLSFAQFEREVIGERVRDKIAASKRKGIWVGGPVPLGYRSLAKKLEIVPEEAQTVRTIFERYLALGSIGLLVEDLHRGGVRPRSRVDRNGTAVDATRFMVGPLAHILKNRFYVGEVAYRGEVHKGEHPAIIEPALFDAVQARLRGRAVERKVKRSKSPCFLAGLLFDDRGNRMSPSHANKKGVRYRYYVSQAILQHRMSEAGTISRVAAPDIEELVAAAIRHHVNAAVDEVTGAPQAAQSTAPEYHLRAKMGEGLTEIDPASAHASAEPSDRDLVAIHVERVVLRPRRIQVTLREGQTKLAQPLLQTTAGEDNDGIVDMGSPMPIVLQVPWTFTNTVARKGIAWKPLAAQGHLDAATGEVLLSAIARARAWLDDLIEARVASFEDIARREGKVERHIRRLMPLAFLSPRIIDAIADGSAPAGTTVSSLTTALSYNWADQERKLGLH